MNLSIDRLCRAPSKLRRRLRGSLWRLRICIRGGSVGRRLEVDFGARLRWPAHPGICIGNDVYIGIGAIVDAPMGCRVLIGNGVKVMHYTVIAASREIRIGRETQIAELSSIRDATHGIDLAIPMKLQLEADPVCIGSDVWIGRGVAVLKGAEIGDGTIIGANSVVRGNVPPYSIAVGAPARVIRVRQ